MKFQHNTRVKVPNLNSGCGGRNDDSFTLKLNKRRVIDDAVALTSLPETTKNKEKLQKQYKTEKPKTSNNIISCRKNTLIGTLNVRTARLDYMRQELANTFNSSGLEILGVQEHRVIHQEPIRMEKFAKGTCLITSSGWRNERDAAQGGVGIMVTKRAYEAITLIKSYSNRILLVSLDGNPRLTVISVYSPTEAYTMAEKEEFHNALRKAIADVPAHHLLLVVGDMNAKLGKYNNDDPGWYYHTATNSNGQLLRETISEGNLEASNHRFQKKRGKLWTHLNDGLNFKSQIDYILISKKWRNSLKNTEAYNFFNSSGSDHRVVISTLKLSLRRNKNTPRRVHYNFDKLKDDEELQYKYAIVVSNRFACLTEETDPDKTASATERYANFIEATKAANKAVLPIRPRRTRDDITNDDRIQDVRNGLFIAKDKYHLNPTEEHREAVAELKQKLGNTYSMVEGEALNKKIKRVEDAAERCKNKESWRLVNELTGRKKRNSGLIEGGSSEGRLENWKNHFSKLLGEPPQVPDENIAIRQIFPTLDIKTSPFTKEELKIAKKDITLGKAHGDDGIPPEVLKKTDLDDIVLDFCNRALLDGDVPDQWKSSNIVPVPKKGDLTKVDNYRGISLTSIVGKTMNRMLLNRIKMELEERLRFNQNGFRPGRSTTSHILALRRILEGAKAKHLPAVLTFIDFKKAFDSVHRGILMKILRAYGIPDIIVDLIERMYVDTMARVITEDGLTEVFRILAGVLQGDTLAPYLFIIVVDYIMLTVFSEHENPGFTITPARSRRVKAEKLTDADFADDITLITDSMHEAQAMLDSLEAAALQVGLKMNDDKTKFMSVNIPEEEPQVIKASSGEDIERVEDFVYLGAWINGSEHDIVVRKAKAWAACHKMKKIWNSNLCRNLKIRLFQATVESVLLYGSEVWSLTATMEKRLDGCYTRMLRMALNVDWREMMTNKKLYGKLPRVTTKIRERRMKLAGHIQRHDDLAAHRLLLWEPLHGFRNRGAPKLTFVDTIRRDVDLQDTGEIKQLMLDRKLWRDRIDARTKKPP